MFSHFFTFNGSRDKKHFKLNQPQSHGIISLCVCRCVFPMVHCVFPGHSIARASAVLSRPWIFVHFDGGRRQIDGMFFTKGMGFLLKIGEVGKMRNPCLGVDVDEILICMMYFYFIFAKVCSSSLRSHNLFCQFCWKQTKREFDRRNIGGIVTVFWLGDLTVCMTDPTRDDGKFTYIYRSIWRLVFQ